MAGKKKQNARGVQPPTKSEAEFLRAEARRIDAEVQAARAKRQAETWRKATADDFTNHVADHYTKHAPEWMEAIGLAIRVCLRQAFTDARQLDEDAAKVGRTGDYLATFLRSVFFDDGFFPALVERAQVPADKKAIRPITLAKQRGEDTGAAFVLYLFREKMKDGWTASDALRWHAEDIGKHFAEGNATLLERLAEAAREPYRPSRQRWMLRAWLPLALWQDVPAHTLAARVEDAWEVESKIDGQLLPDLPRGEGGNPYPIQALIRATRATIRAAARRQA